MDENPGGPDLAALKEMHADLRRLREQVTRLTSGQPAPVPHILAAVLAGPRRSRPVPVHLDCHGRKVTAWVTGGAQASAAGAWASILAAVPETRGSADGQLSANLAPGVISVRDGKTLIVSTAASRADVRACRTAGVAAIGAAAAMVLRRARSSSAVQAGLGGAAAAAVVATGALVISHGHPGSGGLPPGALAPSVRGISSVPAARSAPGGGAHAAGSPETAGTLSRSGTHHTGRVPAAKLVILPRVPPHRVVPVPGVTLPALPVPVPPVPSVLPSGHGHQGIGRQVSQFAHHLKKAVGQATRGLGRVVHHLPVPSPTLPGGL